MTNGVIAWERPRPTRAIGDTAHATHSAVLRTSTYGMTDRGKQRANNEDQFLVARLSRAIQIEHASLNQPDALFGVMSAHLMVVADGMGGHAGGAEASALAVLTMEDFFLNALRWVFRLQGDGILGELQNALRSADQRLFDEASKHPELVGMGTTLTMGYVVRDALYVAHVGDSRCYLFREGHLHQLTTDHTLVGQMVREGLISPEQAATNPMRNVVTNAVGGNEPGVTAEVHKVPLSPGDVVLLCSDGLTGMLGDSEIGAVLRAEPNPEAACRTLVGYANDRGGVDNITAIVSRFDGGQ